MALLNAERVAVPSAGSNTASPRSADSGGVPETKPRAFSAKPKVFLVASALQFLDDFRLAQVTLPGRVRAGQHASQEQFHIERLTHADHRYRLLPHRYDHALAHS